MNVVMNGTDDNEKLLCGDFSFLFAGRRGSQEEEEEEEEG